VTSIAGVAGQPNRSNFQQGLKRVRPSPLFDDSTVTKFLNVHSPQSQHFVGRLDTSPLPPVGAAHREPGNHDVILSHLTLDSDMQIGIAAVEGKDVLPGTFNSNDIGMAFDIIRCQKFRQAMDIAGVHNLLKQSASQQFVVRF
jgi:hypothetical protein